MFTVTQRKRKKKARCFFKSTNTHTLDCILLIVHGERSADNFLAAVIGSAQD